MAFSWFFSSKSTDTPPQNNVPPAAAPEVEKKEVPPPPPVPIVPAATPDDELLLVERESMVNDLEAKLVLSEKDKQSALEKKQELERDIQNLTTRLSSAESEAHDAKALVENFDRKNKELNESLTELEREKMNAIAQLSALKEGSNKEDALRLEKKLKEAEQAYVGEMRRSKFLKDSKVEAERLLEEKDRDVAKLAAQLGQLESKMNDSEKFRRIERERFQKERQDLRDKNAITVRENEKLTAKVAQLEKENAEQVQQIEQLKAELKEAKANKKIGVPMPGFYDESRRHNGRSHKHSPKNYDSAGPSPGQPYRRG